MTDDALTRLLAEKVMGWPVTTTYQTLGERIAEGQGQIVAVKDPGFFGKVPPEFVKAPGFDDVSWEPLERIDHAWQVQEALLRVDPSSVSRLRTPAGLRFLDAMRGGEPGWIGDSKTVACRICLAALRAVGQDVEEG